VLIHHSKIAAITAPMRVSALTSFGIKK
jgi:hypothetical protein